MFLLTDSVETGLSGEAEVFGCVLPRVLERPSCRVPGHSFGYVLRTFLLGGGAKRVEAIEEQGGIPRVCGALLWWLGMALSSGSAC